MEAPGHKMPGWVEGEGTDTAKFLLLSYLPELIPPTNEKKMSNRRRKEVEVSPTESRGEKKECLST